MAEQQDLSVIYGVLLRRTQNSRLVVEIVRDSYTKQLGHLHHPTRGDSDSLLQFASVKPRHFFDAEDEQRLLGECKAFASKFNSPFGRDLARQLAGVNVGSVELGLFLFKGPRIEVRYVGGVVFGTWEPDTGLRLTKDAHPALAGDKKHIAKICSELPQGGGGIFQGEPEEPTL